ncbi:MAG: penicillin-binding protein activator LpoB [Planctomycetes bacterium]|nr:penicillin-binding protein activator LpoB [Planctomycetota bacterium]
MNRYLIALSLFAFAVAPGCSSTRYGNPDDPETINKDWGATDLQQTSQEMVKSLLEAPQLSYLADPSKGQDQRIRLYMGGVANKTSEHIDTSAITDKIRTNLFSSGKFRFVGDAQGQQEVSDQVKFQTEAGKVDPTQIKTFGKQLGAEVVIYGSLRSIEKKKGRSIESGGIKTEYVYYMLTLNCVNVETNEIIWTNEKELTKTQRTGLLGG